jgi:Antirestriction protein
MTACFLCCDLQITAQVREESAAYLASWLAVMRQDKRMKSGPHRRHRLLPTIFTHFKERAWPHEASHCCRSRCLTGCDSLSKGSLFQCEEEIDPTFVEG